MAGLGEATSRVLAIPLALGLSVMADRIRLPGPVLGNDDIVFRFVGQRLFPPIVTAFALYLLYTEMGDLGLELADSYLGPTLATVAFSLPIVIWLMRDLFAALPVEVEEAALVDDVPTWRIFL